jgi:hypothetical protein
MCHLKVKSRSADVELVVTGKIPFSIDEGQNISMYMLQNSTFFCQLLHFKRPYEKIFYFRSINLPSHRHREDPSNSNRVEHLQPEVMPFESEVAESVNDVQVSHFQRHQQTVEAQMGRMLQGAKLLLLLCLSTNSIPSHYYGTTSYIAVTDTVL